MRKQVAIAAITTAALIGGTLGYLQIFTTGLDRLPEKPCAGAVTKNAVKRILPDTRSADERGRGTPAGKNFTFACRILTSDGNIASGESSLQDAAAESWISGYRQQAGETYGELQVQSGSVAYSKLLTLDRLASVYIPCTPPGVDAGNALQQHALISEVRVIGESRVQGKELREALRQFALQMSDHAYKLGKCRQV